MRVIAGSAGGVPLKAPPSGTRPTTDRVREAVFSVLADWAGQGGAPAAHQLAGLAVADLFAGSGAVAVEAMSRGAARAVAVDVSAAAVRTIRANAAAAGLVLEVVRASVEAYVSSGNTERFDVVWLDPPYEQGDEVLDAVIARVADSWLAGDGLVAVERSARGRAPAWPPRLARTWSRRYGETVVHFAQAAQAEDQETP